MGGSETVGDFSVDISGGDVTINSQGDGLDSNGNATISGGTVVVNGPSNDGNGALDVNGELAVTGGTVAAAGSAGMAVTPGASSPQSGVQLSFGTAVAAGTNIPLLLVGVILFGAGIGNATSLPPLIAQVERRDEPRHRSTGYQT